MTVSEQAMTGRKIVVDVRDELRAGLEPFRKIMAAVDETFVGDTLVLYATFKPIPLLLLLKRQGFESKVTRLARGDWRVDFRRVSGPRRHPAAGSASERSGEPVSALDAGAPSPDDYADIHLDNRGLEPPEPMVRTLEAVHKLKKGQRIIGRFDRTPMFLLPKLEEMGFVYEVEPADDGRATVTIRHGD